MKRNFIRFIFLFFFFNAFLHIKAQEVRVIDNKGTVKNINKVSYGTTVPTLTSPSNNVKGDIYIIGTATSPEKTFLFDGTQWVEISSQNDWSLTGNAGTNTSTNFLGTTDNNDLIIKTNNYERMRIGSTAFSPIAEVLINGATPNANTTTNYPLIVRAHGNAGHVLRLQNAGSNQNWNFNARNSSQLDLTYNTNTTPNILFMQSGNVAIGGYPAPELAKLDVFGRLRVRDLPEFNPIQNNAKLIFVTDDGGSTSPNNVLKKTAASAFISEVTQTVTTGNEIARHTANGTTTVINETITSTSQVVPATGTSPATATDANENGFIKYKAENQNTETEVARVVSTDANNKIKVGSDGGAYLNTPAIVAAGKVTSTGFGSNTSCDCFNANVSVATNNSSSTRGKYVIQLTPQAGISDTRYIIQITAYDENTSNGGLIETTIIGSYELQTSSGFQVNIQNTAGGNLWGSFMFTVLKL